MFTRRGVVLLGVGTAVAGIHPVRAQEENLSLKSFVPAGPAPADYTDIFAKALAEASRRNLGELFVPPGRYPLRKLVLPNGVVIKGAGKQATVLIALASEEDSLVSLASGPVQHAGLKSLSIVGGTMEKSINPGQWALRLIAQPAKTGKAHGGLWWSSFEDLRISNFEHGIWLDGGVDSYLLPHQYISFRDIGLYGWHRSPGPAVRMSGQVNQLVVSQVHMNGWRDIGLEIVKSSTGKTSPKLHHYDVVTIEQTGRAVIIDGAQNIQFTTCWFEQDASGILVRDGSVGIGVAGSRFANTGKKDAAVVFEDGATGNVTGNIFAGADTKQSIRVKTSENVEVTRNNVIWGARE